MTEQDVLSLCIEVEGMRCEHGLPYDVNATAYVIQDDWDASWHALDRVRDRLHMPCKGHVLLSPGVRLLAAGPRPDEAA